ncbi:putative RNA-directed DNA polymerase [Tanacetum coccineum]
MVRSMMCRATLPISFWGYALEIATHILNLVPIKKVSKTPFEMWKGKRPSHGNIKIWGSEVFVRREAQDKLDARSEKSRRGVFLKREMISKEDSKSKIDLEEIQESVDVKPIVNIDTQQEVVTPVKPDDIFVPICKTSSRVSKPPQFYYGFYIEEDKIRDSTLSELDEPTNYKEAMESPGAAKWKEAMKREIQSMYDNQVWNLVDTTPGIKMVGCKWIFKKKTNMDGKVHNYKARIMLAIAAFQDYEIWQMDVNTAFLNGKLIEDVFMVQPEGFENAKYPKRVCNLQKDIYGLKHASRSWNLYFHEKVT